MKKLLLALGLVVALVALKPAPAAADFSLSIGLPGFGLFIADPIPPPIAYGSPAYYYPAPPVVYHRYPVYHRYHRHYPGCGHYGRHKRYSRHYRHWDD